MAAINWKISAQGLVTNAQATIFTAPTPCFLKTLRFYSGAAAQTVTLWLKQSGGTARELDSWVLGSGEKGSVDFPVSMNTGDTLEAQATTTNVVRFNLMGAERAP